MEIRHILSLFDGMSCGQIALKELDIRFEKYFTSEIDKYAIGQTQLNFPATIQLLENVNMKRSHMMVINEMTGVFPVNINSSLVSAQNRNRWYWTNVRTKMLGLFGEVYSDIPQPQDEGIFLKDILETSVDEKYYISAAVINRMLRKQYSAPLINPNKAGTLNTKNNSGQMSLDSGTTFISEPICTAMRGRGTDSEKEIRKVYETGKVKECRKNMQQLEQRKDGKTNCLTSVQKDNLILIFHSGVRLRRLTPTECARLQTIPQWYKWQCSETQQYKMLGNGWTVKVIIHILQFLTTSHHG